ncbi:hypothetical protein RB213_010048, partial [Colletotrichum asianum]
TIENNGRQLLPVRIDGGTATGTGASSPCVLHTAPRSTAFPLLSSGVRARSPLANWPPHPENIKPPRDAAPTLNKAVRRRHGIMEVIGSCTHQHQPSPFPSPFTPTQSERPSLTPRHGRKRVLG